MSETLERRTAILDIARRADLLVVEDNPYGLLGFDGEPTPAMRSLEEDRVIYLGSFSKTFAPGFRVGWVLAPHAVRKLVLAQESATLCPPAFCQYAITAYLANHDWRGQIKIFREMYRERRDAMLAGLADDMPPGTSWTCPPEGSSSGSRCRLGWTRTPCSLGPSPLGWRVPGTAFYADGFGSRHMRLSYCYPTSASARAPDGSARCWPTRPGVLETFGPGSAEMAGRLCDRTRLQERIKNDRTLPTVVVLAGGLSHERDVSLRSGRRVSQALRSRGVEVVESDVDSSLLPRLADLPGAVVFPVLHGETGEDGALREVLNLLEVPFVGSIGSACRVAFDKSIATTVIADAGLATPARWPCRMKSSESSELRHSSARSGSRLASR